MPRLLLVEDDRGLCQFICDVLEREHFALEKLHEGDSAWAGLSTQHFDLIILDWELPHISGVELAKRFRAGGGMTPILMLTGKKEIDDKGAGFEAGVDDYLTKPFDPRELVMRVKALLRRPLELADAAVVFADLLLDPEKYRITKNGRDLMLTPAEFKLLEYLMRHPGQVFSAEVLLDRVWSMEADVSVDAVRNCVVRLRKKIDNKGSNSLIENVYGLGYRMIAPDTSKRN